MAGTENIVAIEFAERSKAYQALNVLQRADANGRIGLRGAVLVERDEARRIQTPAGTANTLGEGTVAGSLIGMLIGILEGPIGMLLGWSAGAAVGGIVDVRRAQLAEEALSAFGQSIPPGGTAILADVNELAVEVIDGEMSQLGGQVTRRPATEVLAEMEAAEEATAAAQRDAKRVLREQRKAERREQREERLAKLQAKLHGQRTTQ